MNCMEWCQCVLCCIDTPPTSPEKSRDSSKVHKRLAAFYQSTPMKSAQLHKQQILTPSTPNKPSSHTAPSPATPSSPTTTTSSSSSTLVSPEKLRSKKLSSLQFPFFAVLWWDHLANTEQEEKKEDKKEEKERAHEHDKDKSLGLILLAGGELLVHDESMRHRTY